MQAPIEEAIPAAAPDGHTIVGVRFMPVGKVYHFDGTHLRDLRSGDWVIVSTTRGRQMGQVASLEPPKHGAADGPFKLIERMATNRDLALKKYWETQEVAAMVTAREKAQHLRLACKIVKADYTFDGTRLGFLYSVEENVEINVEPLRSALQPEFNARIDMRLIGPRDAAKIIGGGGACGLTERCCSGFLTDFSPISVKMAKEQGLSLNPQEITGMCGRLRCCLLYEYEQYVAARKLLPKRNKEVGTPHGNGKVIDVLPLKDAVLVLVGETRHEVARADLQPLAELAALQQKVEEPCGGSHGWPAGRIRRPAGGATSEINAVTNLPLLNELRAALGQEAVATDAATLTAYAYDGTWAEQRPAVVLHPRSTDQVSAILRLADRERIAVVPRGAATGLAGGAVPIEGSWCLNLARMNRILAISPEDSIVIAQPGVVTATLQQAVEAKGLMYPPDPASLYMCTIGGNVSTNAGGPRCLKYGVTADYVLGLEVVLPGGKIMRVGGRTIKNVAGYNLKQLIVGSEGTLAVVTEITLRLVPKPKAQLVALAAFAKLSAACEAVGKILASGITPLVTEIMDADVIRAIDDLQRSRKQPSTLPLDADALLLVGVDGDPEEVERDIAAIAEVLSKSGATSVRQARTPEESEALWEARRSVSPAIIRLGNSRFGEDIVVPRSKIPQMVELTKQIGKQYDLTIAVFGHIGDGNLHPNIVCDRRDAEMMKRVEAASHAIFDAAIELGGAISGEHGIGLLKTEYMPKSVDPVALAMMQSIKKLIDPNNIMNPGKKLGVRDAVTW